MEIASPPTSALLAKLFEFPVPLPFVRVVHEFWAAAQETGESVGHLFDAECGFYLRGYDARYQQTPPELFPIGRLGVDGVHYGYVIHAPERPAGDFPVGEFCPMDGDGVTLLGNSTEEAFENLLSGRAADSGDAARRRRIAEKLGLTLSDRNAQRRYDPKGNYLQVKPSLPPDYLHVMTGDGIGVAAPQGLFRPGGSFDSKAGRWSLEKVLDRAQRDLEDGYPATALAHLRESYWHHWFEDGAISRYGAPMQRVYEALGRPLLAEVVARRVAQFA